MKTLRHYLKIAEAARLLGVSQNTLRKWVDEGKIKASVVPANGYRLFRRQDLEKFLHKATRPVRPVRIKKAK